MTTSNTVFAEPKARNTFGILAVILAAAGFLLAIIPIFGVIGWPLLIAAFVLGIIGVTRQNQPKTAAIVGLVLSVFAFIAAPFIALSILVA